MALPKYQKAVAAAQSPGKSPKPEPKKRGRKPAQSPTPVKDAPRAASSEPPSKKRGKASPAAAHIAAANVAAAKRASIVQAIMEAQCVPESVREMLCSTLPECCNVTGKFHPFQEKTMHMLNQTLKDIQSEKARKTQKAANIASRAKEELERVEKEHANVEAAVTVSNADAKEKEAALAQSVAVLQPCKSALEKAQAELQRGDAVIGAAAMEAEQLRSARAMMCNASDEVALARLQELCSGWLFAAEKLKNVTLLEGELCQRLAMLNETISKAAVARVALAAEFHGAQAHLDVAVQKQKACAATLARTQAERQERVAMLNAKAQSLKQHKAAASQTGRAWHAAQRQLAEFEKGPQRALKDIIAEIEQHHGIQLNGDATAKEAEPVTPSPEESGIAASKDMPLLFHDGKPVIDRRQRQAVLRRRSAALPMYCFSRLSMMARRSSVAAKRRISIGINETGNGSEQITPLMVQVLPGSGCGSDSEGENQKDQRLMGATLEVPTPNRSAIMAGLQ